MQHPRRSKVTGKRPPPSRRYPTRRNDAGHAPFSVHEVFHDPTGIYYGVSVVGDVERTFRWRPGTRVWELASVAAFNPALGTFDHARGETGKTVARRALADPGLQARAMAARAEMIAAVKKPLRGRGYGSGAGREVLDALGRAVCEETKHAENVKKSWAQPKPVLESDRKRWKEAHAIALATGAPLPPPLPRNQSVRVGDGDKIGRAMRGKALALLDAQCAPGTGPDLWAGPCEATLRDLRDGDTVACGTIERAERNCPCQWSAELKTSIKSGELPADTVSGTPVPHAPGEHYACDYHPWSVERVRVESSSRIPDDPGGSVGSLMGLPREEQHRIMHARGARAQMLAGHPWAAHWRAADDHRREEAERLAPKDRFDGQGNLGMILALQALWKGLGGSGYDWGAAAYVQDHYSHPESIFPDGLGSASDGGALEDAICEALGETDDLPPSILRWVTDNPYLAQHCKTVLDRIATKKAAGRKVNQRQRARK